MKQMRDLRFAYLHFRTRDDDLRGRHSCNQQHLADLPGQPSTVLSLNFGSYSRSSTEAGYNLCPSQPLLCADDGAEHLLYTLYRRHTQHSHAQAHNYNRSTASGKK